MDKYEGELTLKVRGGETMTFFVVDDKGRSRTDEPRLVLPRKLWLKMKAPTKITVTAEPSYE